MTTQADPPVTLRGPRVLLRPALEADMPVLLAILDEPAVARWWQTAAYDRDGMSDELVSAEAFCIVAGDIVVGWIGFYEEKEPDYRHAGIDIFLTTSVHGRGYGPEAIRALIDHLVARGHHRFIIDPAVANERAIAAYASVGFRPVGVMRDYERGADGTWHDGLLMDLVSRDLES